MGSKLSAGDPHRGGNEEEEDLGSRDACWWCRFHNASAMLARSSGANMPIRDTPLGTMARYAHLGTTQSLGVGCPERRTLGEAGTS